MQSIILAAGGLRSPGLHLSNDSQSDIWSQVEHYYAYLVKPDPGQVHGVEDIDGHMNPMAHEAVHPIMRQRKHQEPHHVYGDVDYSTPSERSDRLINSH
jgi:hypothetical protein